MEWCSLPGWLPSPLRQSMSSPTHDPPSHFHSRSPKSSRHHPPPHPPPLNYHHHAYGSPRQSGRSTGNRNMPATRSVRQETINPGDDSRSFISKLGSGSSRKRYKVAIAARGLKWQYLKEYLELEFPEVKFSGETVLKENYIVILPSKLDMGELQDIDLLRGNEDAAEEFLADLREEKQKGQR